MLRSLKLRNGFRCVFFLIDRVIQEEGLDSQLDPVGPTRGGARTGILRFTMDIFVYK